MTRLIRDQIADLIAVGLRAAQELGELPAFDLPAIPVEHARQSQLRADYASPVCMGLARSARMAPRDIAARIVAHLPQSELVSSVEAAGPGYINFVLAQSWLTAQVSAIRSAGDTYGQIDLGHGSALQVEFVSANPTGPLTVGSARNAAIGDVLASILSAAGYRVEREYYVNDAGSQVRKFGESVYARYAEALGKDEPFPEDGYRGQYLIELGKEIAARDGAQHLARPYREAVRGLGAEGLARMVDWIRDDLRALGIEFDTWFHEKSLYDSGLSERILADLRSRGYIIEKEGAVWFKDRETDLEAVVIRSPGVIADPDERPTYFASDIAYMWNKLVERGFERAIYVWGADHHGDLPRMKSGAKALGLDPERVEIVLYQMVNLKRGGEEVRMSKRTGEFVTLRELLDDVGPDAIRFLLLTRTVDATMEFDLDLAVEQSEQNPVFYVQYAHARISSILRHAAELGWRLDAGGDLGLLVHDAELGLIRKMLELPEVVALAASQLAPHHMTFYAQELAAAFHSFYRDCRVIDQTAPQMTQARLLLADAARLTLAQALALLGVGAPERM
jgi:arginyl-tRNA synthetase